MQFYILLALSLIICGCNGATRRSGGTKPTNSGKDTDANTAFWAARGKRNDLSGLIRCVVRTPEDSTSDSDLDLNWPRISSDPSEIRSDINAEAWNARFKRNVGAVHDPSSLEQYRSVYLPGWLVRAYYGGNVMANQGNIHSSSNTDALSNWLRLVEKRSEKDAGSGSSTTDTANVPFWAARG